MRTATTNPLTRGRACLAAGLLALATATPGFAAGLLKPADGSHQPIEIVDHQVAVTMNNGFVRTEVTQVIGNQADRDFEAIYSFPLPEKASFSELSLWINGQEVVGEVLEKEQARKVYEEQVAAGNDTALAEKDDFKTFDISVGRIPAGQKTTVRFVYYQPLEIDMNIGRYVYPLAEGGVDEERIQFWQVDDRVTGTFTFDAEIKSAFPIKDVRVPGYQDLAVISKGDADLGGEGAHHVHLDGQGGNLSQDIVVYYRLDDQVPARVELVPYKESASSPGTFMVVVTPAADLQLIEEGTDWVFILDVSGSMSGHKIATLADGVTRVLGKMDGNDRFRIVTFNDRARDLTGGYVQGTPAAVSQWCEKVKRIQAGGGTALFDGMKQGYKRLDDDRTTGVILVTDGVANIGPTEQKHFLQLVRDTDLRLFTFVIGNSANQPLLQRITRESGGFAMSMSDQDDMVGRLLQAKTKVLHQSMHDVTLTVKGPGIEDITPRVIGNQYYGQQQVIFGHYSRGGEVDVILEASISGTPQRWTCRTTLPDVDTDNPELERLWALSRIEEEMESIREFGETADRRQQVAQLGVEYSLVTDYTSMLVVQEEVFENQGVDRRNADRVHRERTAQTQRAQKAPTNYRVDKQSNGQSTFGGRSSPGLGGGSGPIGPLFLGLLALCGRRKRNG